MNLEVVVAADDQKFTAAIVFGSNLEAKAAKINHDAQMALLWKLCENIDREIAIEVIDRLPLEFSKGMEKRKDDYDLSSSQLSDLIIHCANGIYSQPIRERL